MRRKPTPPAAPPPDLAAQAQHLLATAKWREASEAFKQLLKQEPRGGWEGALAQAYQGRATELANKGMPKEALVLLDNAERLIQTPALPELRLACLLATGKPEAAGLFFLTHEALFKEHHPRLAASFQELLAILLLTGGVPEKNLPPGSPWREPLATARQALTLLPGGDDAALDAALARIPLRSPFKPLRLLLKGMQLAHDDPAKARQLATGVAPDSPWAGLARVVTLACLDREEFPRQAASQPPRVAELAARLQGCEPTAWRTAHQLLTAPPPRALSLLLDANAAFPPEPSRRAALALLVGNLNAMPQFERRFGGLDPLEKQRLAALAQGATIKSVPPWREYIRLLRQHAPPDHDLLTALTHRHIASLILTHNPYDSQGIRHLEESVELDPGDRQNHILLMTWYEKADDAKALRACLERALKHHPDDAELLHGAVREALAAKAYKKASRLAKRLLTIDPLHPGVRRDLVGACLEQARKQIKAKRPDLAARELDEAESFLRPEERDGAVTLNRAFLAWLTGRDDEAETLLNAGVQEAGGGVVGWFMAMTEGQRASLGPVPMARLRQDLAASARSKPRREEVLIVVRRAQELQGRQRDKISALMKELTSLFTHALTLKGYGEEEFRQVCDLLDSTGQHDLLKRYATLGLKQWRQQPWYVYYQLVGKCQDDASRLTDHDRDLLLQAMDQAEAMGDEDLADLIDAWLMDEDDLDDLDDDLFDDDFPHSLPRADDKAWVEMLIVLLSEPVRRQHLRREDTRRLLEEMLGREGAFPPNYFTTARRRELINLVLARLHDGVDATPPAPPPRRKGRPTSPDQLNLDIDFDT